MEAKLHNVTKEFLGQTFEYQTFINDGHALWTDEIDNQFNLWLNDLKSKNRDIYKVQYNLSGNAFTTLQKLRAKLGNIEESLLVRAITITFINIIDTRKGSHIIKKLRTYRESSDAKTLDEGAIEKSNLYFSPTGMRDVEAYSQLTGLVKAKVIQNAIYSVLLISINEDSEIKEFWQHEILGQITLMLKAA